MIYLNHSFCGPIKEEVWIPKRMLSFIICVHWVPSYLANIFLVVSVSMRFAFKSVDWVKQIMWWVSCKLLSAEWNQKAEDRRICSLPDWVSWTLVFSGPWTKIYTLSSMVLRPLSLNWNYIINFPRPPVFRCQIIELLGFYDSWVNSLNI